MLIKTNFQPSEGAIKTLLDALLTDGAHHKQYGIEKALRQICGSSWVDIAKKTSNGKMAALHNAKAHRRRSRPVQ